MRDSVLVIAFLGLVAGGYYYFRDKPFVYSPSSLLQSLKNKGELSREELIKSARKNSKDKIAAGQSIAEGGEAESRSSKLEELPHLYTGKGKPVKLKKLKKFVHGVPVEGWIQDQKNHLALRAVAPDTNSGLKVYMQCMEVKGSGAKALTPKECNALAERHRQTGLSHALGGVQ